MRSPYLREYMPRKSKDEVFAEIVARFGPAQKDEVLAFLQERFVHLKRPTSNPKGGDRLEPGFYLRGSKNSLVPVGNLELVDQRLRPRPGAFYDLKLFQAELDKTGGSRRSDGGPSRRSTPRDLDWYDNLSGRS